MVEMRQKDGFVSDGIEDGSVSFHIFLHECESIQNNSMLRNAICEKRGSQHTIFCIDSHWFSQERGY